MFGVEVGAALYHIFCRSRYQLLSLSTYETPSPPLSSFFLFFFSLILFSVSSSLLSWGGVGSHNVRELPPPPRDETLIVFLQWHFAVIAWSTLSVIDLLFLDVHYHR